MANKARFVIAESSIKIFFKNATAKVFTTAQLSEILEENRISWKLPASMNVDKFKSKLIDSQILETKNIVFNGAVLDRERYVGLEASIFQIALSLSNKSFLSHFTAAYLHGLTNQIPKVVYVSTEQSNKSVVKNELKQEAIDIAFSKPQRKSGSVSNYGDYSFLLHEGKYSNRIGIYSMNNLNITNIERTLVDIAVRPGYAGGVDSVLDIYRKAIDKISVNKLVAILDKLDFIYPYHQAIGFYLERAGMDSKKLDVLRKRDMKYDFYLTYEMIEREYDANWRLYYPKGM